MSTHLVASRFILAASFERKVYLCKDFSACWEHVDTHWGGCLFSVCKICPHSLGCFESLSAQQLLHLELCSLLMSNARMLGKRLQPVLATS